MQPTFAPLHPPAMSLRTVACLFFVAPLLALAACGGDTPEESSPTPSPTAADAPEPTQPSETDEAEQRFPDVLAAEAQRSGQGAFRFDVTVSSPYDTPERYADAWRVVGPDGEVYGVRELLHDHAGEQPFTRSLEGVEIPPGITTVTVEARDLANGWGGATLDVSVPQ